MSYITTIIIVITAIVSFISFNNQQWMNKLIFNPPAINRNNEWYRFITCGFIHADILHLLFNMYSLYLFGSAIELFFNDIFGDRSYFIFLLFYISSLIVCLMPTYYKQKDNYNYYSLGASGAVSAIVFVYIFISPSTSLGLMFIPIKLPAYLFGIIYLGVTFYLDKRGQGNINHSAHLWGALYGIIYFILVCKINSRFIPIDNFIYQVKESLHLL